MISQPIRNTEGIVSQIIFITLLYGSAAVLLLQHALLLLATITTTTVMHYYSVQQNQRTEPDMFFTFLHPIN
jgi:uncharacterized membrane-anchored protein YitT (DUF2179 family)